MKTTHVANYNEKFLKSVVLYADAVTNLLYYSADKLPKNLVPKLELKNLFDKGLVHIDNGSGVFVPIKLVKNTTTNEYNVMIYDGTATATYSSEDNFVYTLHPTYTASTRVIVIPNQTGVSYFLDGGSVPLTPGNQTALAVGKDSATVTAAAQEGYALDPESVLEWVFDIRKEVAPTAASFAEATGIITIPNKTGCVYKIDGVVTDAGATDPIEPNTSVEVAVEPDAGYKLKEGATTSWTFEWTGTEA